MITLETEFKFAGFSFPRYVARMACGPAALRKKWAGRKVCGEYYHAPKPNNREGRGFYLGENDIRWKWADDVATSIRHSGWFFDAYQDQKIRGIVIYLPHGRYLAGWAMGEGMAASMDYDIYEDEISAALAADSMAECAAESEREYQESLETDGDE